MNNYKATGLAEGWLHGDPEDVIEAWQYLHNTGLAYSLQGWFGRTAKQLVQEGVIDE